MRAHPSPDLQFNVILSFSSETSVFFAASSTLKSIILSPTTPKVKKALERFLQSAISKFPIMTVTTACNDSGNDDYGYDNDDEGNGNDGDGNDNVCDNDYDDDDDQPI